VGINVFLIADYSQEGSSQTKHGHGHIYERVGDGDHEHMHDDVLGDGKVMAKGG